MHQIFLLILIFFITACSSLSRQENADSIADGFSHKLLSASPFMLTSYVRIQSPGDQVHLYIEGDGLAWINRGRPSLDPTPRNPIALKLATLDPTNNVIYLARPCQYSNLVTAQPCPQKYWTSHRFAPELVDAMNAALEQLKQQYAITGFHLIGFSGGANIAALLAEKRDDILSLRTVAGNLDHVLLHELHQVSQIPQSLNAKDSAHLINHIPQHHFIGEKDDIVTTTIIQSYIDASGKTHCIRQTSLPDSTHNEGWIENWHTLLNKPIDCNH